MKSRSRHKPTQNSSALQCRLHKQEARCQKTHSCSPSSVWASSHLECIVAAGMAGEMTYNQMMLWRRLSSLFTRADLPSSALASPWFLPILLPRRCLQRWPLLCSVLVRKMQRRKTINGPEAACLQLWRCESEEMGFTGMNSARRVRLRMQSNEMWGNFFCSSLQVFGILIVSMLEQLSLTVWACVPLWIGAISVY